MAKFIIVLTFDTNPDEIAEVITKINPPSLPGFAGTARIAVDPVATKVEEWLDE